MEVIRTEAIVPEDTDFQLLEAWAEHCINSGIPLEDILSSNGGSCPIFLPTSTEGVGLIKQIRGT